MSCAYKCDRCNKLYERPKDDDVIAAISVKFVDNYNTGYRDLCPECAKEFFEWFSKYEKESIGGNRND